MAFKRLARFEDGGSTHYGDVLESDENSYLVQKLKGSISSGFESDLSRPIRVEKVPDSNSIQLLRLFGNADLQKAALSA